MTELAEVARLLSLDHGLCVVSTLRADGSIQKHPIVGRKCGRARTSVSGAPVVGFVARGAARKLANLRRRRRATVTARAGWEWAAVEGAVELIGPEDRLDTVDADGVRLLLRDIFTAAGGTHDDWDTYDAVMAAERRTAALVSPERVYSNG